MLFLIVFLISDSCLVSFKSKCKICDYSVSHSYDVFSICTILVEPHSCFFHFFLTCLWLGFYRVLKHHGYCHLFFALCFNINLKNTLFFPDQQSNLKSLKPQLYFSIQLKFQKNKNNFVMSLLKIVLQDPFLSSNPMWFQ